jgi:hypothetical protein
MHSCYNCYIVYGFSEMNSDASYLDNESLEILQVEIYASCVVKAYAYGLVYGISCEFDCETGTISISDEKKQIVENAYQKFMKTFKPDSCKLEYFKVIDGDYEIYQDCYDGSELELN